MGISTGLITGTLLLLLSGTLAAPSLGFSSRSTSSSNTSTSAENATTADVLEKQMRNPAEMLSVLLIIGADIVQKAIAQLSGTSLRFTPVAFSFGWVAYAFGATMSAFGDGILMPYPEGQVNVVSLYNGMVTQNESWIIFRLVRDLEMSLDTTAKYGIHFYWTNGSAGRPSHDRLSYLFTIILPAQFILAAVPVWKYHDWAILMVTALGTILAGITGSIPQWRDQKYNGRHGKAHDYILTRGNRHKHNLVILHRDNKPLNISLSDLAITKPGSINSNLTRMIMSILAVFWVVLLIVVCGLRQNAWYLFGVGALGMLQNVVVAGYKRSSKAHGIPLEPADKKKITADNAKELIEKAEKARQGLGIALLDIYFPGYAAMQLDGGSWDDKRKHYWANQNKK